MLQILVDIAPAGAAMDHTADGKVISLDPTTPATLKTARESVATEIDALFSQLASGWTPTSAAESVALADARVADAEAALERAKQAQTAAVAAEDAAKTEAAEADNAPKKVAYTGTEHRTRTTKRRTTDSGNANGANRRVGMTDRRTATPALR